MPIPTYTPGYPPDGSSLGQTKSTIRNNLDGTFQTLNVDHVNNNGQPGSNPAGYHTIIHQVPQTAVTTVNGYNQVFSGVPGTLTVDAVATPAIPAGGDAQLYSLTGLGTLSQLSGHNAATNGYQWIGGVLLQWGSATAVADGTIVAFNVPFPNSLFSLTVSHSAVGAGENTGAIISAASKTTAGFTFRVSGSASASYSYVAIGR